MSREERKMAQIIASIERMEQRRPASRTASPVAQSPDSPSAVESAESAAEELQPQKKAPAMGMKIQPVATVREGTPEDGEQGQAPRITPKKRWIQLWNAQLHENPVPSSSTDSSAAADKEDGAIPTEQLEAEASVLGHSAVDIEMKDVSGDVEALAQSPALIAIQTTAAVTPNSSLVPAVEELRVKTPAVVESSHLSPPLDRNSPTTSASISPSTKVKESAAEEPAAAKATLREAPLSTASPSEPRNRTSSPMPSLSPQAEKPETPKETAALTDTRELQQPLHKRSLERKEPMTEEEQRRADRRRKRKTNWDVGDPRNGSSGETSSALTKFPAGRPSWRHSHSMDTKPYFHTSHRSSFHNHSAAGSSSSSGPPASGSGRRPFYHSTSLPTEHRSRSLSRPSSTRYNSSSSGSFR